MSLESDIAILQGAALFESLTIDQLRLLAFGAEHRRLRPGETLFREEARSDAAFVIALGEVSLYRRRGGNLVHVGRFGPGTLLGELALITENRRPATAITESDCDLIRIPRALFLRMLQEYPEIALRLHDQIKDDLLDMTRRLAALEDRFTD
ncbi:cyclic nucleotide-binding domain-containing protein [Consotaella salsifontis]|uniref:Cyclic nucleotide-binding domain-containing protein n=1 Tax=Consotaella salsifontis TaxID=1365950 RepID=A0A1T4SJ77_9HYPH|nr:cyclic nucleotide-binding domain-containing protein [Consotaella salsifontis]SKA27891.1 Cyclic nucleotide-binding domain-containing protein [Consotaella salsifontis]